jgi:hypothetical protein
LSAITSGTPKVLVRRRVPGYALFGSGVGPAQGGLFTIMIIKHLMLRRNWSELDQLGPDDLVNNPQALSSLSL